jgi:hypothetical protein
MSQDPNAWWSKEIARDLNKGMTQTFVDSRQAWRQRTPQERRQVLRMILGIAILEGGIAYALYRLVMRYAYSR